MGTSISNGYDAKTHSETPEKTKNGTKLTGGKGSVSYKVEASAVKSASVSESANINNTYSFNLSLASAAVSASTKDLTNLGGSFVVAYGLKNPLSKIILPPKIKDQLNNWSTKLCLTYAYTDTLHHRGKSFSLKTNRVGIDATILPTQYGTLPVIVSGGERIDVCASSLKSAAAKSSLNMIKGVMAGFVATQVGALAAGATIKSGVQGSSGFRGNATDSVKNSIGISIGASLVAITPLLMMLTAERKSEKFQTRHLKGPDGGETPNASGILLDACRGAAADSDQFSINGKDVLFQSGLSSLQFDKNGSITAKGKNCSFETKNEGVKAGIFLQPESIKVMAGQESHISIDTAAIELKNKIQALKLSAAGAQADEVRVAPGGVSIPGGTFVNAIANFA